MFRQSSDWMNKERTEVKKSGENKVPTSAKTKNGIKTRKNWSREMFRQSYDWINEERTKVNKCGENKVPSPTKPRMKSRVERNEVKKVLDKVLIRWIKKELKWRKVMYKVLTLTNQE